ncbi:MAG: hypothetical protein CME68_07350 [Halobacteriovoraceae bacterium]|nr:hypothetical protein [Halobacteriovoraceae bacterium]
MLKIIRKVFVGPPVALLIFINMFFWTTLLIFLAAAKAVHKSETLERVLDRVYQLAVAINTEIFKKVLKVYIIVQGDTRLEYSKNYLVISNHVSWSDTFITQGVMNQIIPPFRFLSKKEVKYIPFVGFISWAYNFPLLSRNKLEKDKKKIIENTKNLGNRPISFFIYPEGTRFTKIKKKQQESPFKYLLKPKIGALTTLLKTDIEYENIVDITLLYPKTKISFWDLLSGNISHVYVYIRKLTIKKETPPHQIKSWMYQKWKEKDNLIRSFRD